MARAKDRFKSLTFNGPQMPDEYKQDVFELKGQKISVEAAEGFVMLARYIDTDYYKDATFRKNSWDYWKKLLPKSLQTKLEDFEPEFHSYHDKQVADKEAAKKLETKEDREAKKAEREAKKQQFGYAIVDGKRTPIAGYMIEGPGYIITRGADPRKGSWKARVKPSDVTVNIVGDPAKTKELQTKGYKVVSNPDVLWLFKYDMQLSSTSVPINKKVIFAGNSEIGQGQDVAKYIKATELLNRWDEMQAHIKGAIGSNDAERRQSAIIAYLTQRTGIRVGSDKDTSVYADTVGASTLRAKNVAISGTTLHLDFLGKDSVPLVADYDIDDYAAKAIAALLATKKPNDKLFDKADATEVNMFLKELIPDVSPKTFRTANGTATLVAQLKKQSITVNSSLLDKKRALFAASLETSKLLNHQKNVGKNAADQEAKAKDKVKAAKEKSNERKTKATEQLKKIKVDIETAKSLWKGAKLKDKIGKLNEKMLRIKSSVERAELNIDKQQFNLEMKKGTQDISLSTARAAYCDPRVLFSWAKDVNFPIAGIYSKSMLDRFSWAEGTDADFWKQYPNG
jgi:DNA topoisomerase-1